MSLDAERYVAVVGMACRVPGAADVAEFWRKCVDGVDSVSRWDATGRVGAAGLLESADVFDAAFFGLTPAEAEMLDPQHRVFLEVAWHAMESAGVRPGDEELVVSVYASAAPSGHRLPEAQDGHTRYLRMLSTTSDFLATRVAHLLDLKGEAVTVQTACSSSLVAVHQAAHALTAGLADVALAGGVSIDPDADLGYEFEEGMILSPDGRCRPFDARANGTVNGNGAGVVVLQRLGDAVAQGRPIHAVLLSTAANNDGRPKPSFMAPSIRGQAEVVATALALADVPAHSIGYFEAHGTGTRIGDPIEIEAARQAYAMFTQDKGFCALGSVKANVGHLGRAAGVTGLIKAVCAVRDGVRPPLAGYDAPNPDLDLDSSPFRLPGTAEEWQDQVRRAAVSSFGVGGTNAHAIVQRYTQPAQPRFDLPVALPVSAPDTAGLRRVIDQVARLDVDRGDLAHTLAAGRFSHEEARAVVVDGTPRGEGEATSGPLVFCFPGQAGEQSTSDVTAMYDRYPVFRAEIDACAAALDRPATALLDVSGGNPYQPALVAVELACAKLLQHVGVRPDLLMGSSLGEYAAAGLAGVFERDALMRLLDVRDQLVRRTRPGAMLTVSASAEKLTDLIGPEIAIAAENASDRAVLSGSVTAVEAAERWLTDRGLRWRRLPGAIAFHSPLMDPVLGEFEAAVRDARPRPAGVPAVSTLTGADEHWGAARYWAEHLREPIRLHDAYSTATGSGHRRFVEIGPGTALTSLVGRDFDVSATSVGRGFAQALAVLWRDGSPVDWDAVNGTAHRRFADIPGYPFAPTTVRRHARPLLDTRVELPDGVVLSGTLSTATHPWLADHALGGTPILPGTGFLEIALQAADGISELTLHTPLAIEPEGTEVRVIVRDDELTVQSCGPGGTWVRNATGVVGACGRAEEIGPWPPEAEPVTAGRTEGGFHYGPAFQGLRRVWRRDDEVFAEAVLPAPQTATGFGLHPALLDAALHACVASGLVSEEDGRRGVAPFSWTGARLHAKGAAAIRVKLTRHTGGIRVSATDFAGRPVLSVDSLVLRPVATTGPDLTDSLFRMDWVPAALPPVPDHVMLTDDLATLPTTPVVVLRVSGVDDPVAATHTETTRVLETLRAWLADPRWEQSKLVILTRDAVMDGNDPACSAVWGLVRAAQTEQPGRFFLVDGDEPMLGDEPQLVTRGDRAWVPRLSRVERGPWRWAVTTPGTIDGVTRVPSPAVPLEPGQVRVAVRAGGVNFRDVLLSLDLYPGEAELGSEGAGVVLEAGPDVDLVPGERVFGLLTAAFGPVAVTDHRLLARMPADWTFTQAAAVPVAFLTAWHGLVDLGGLRARETVLIHAAAGGVGMAAVQLAQHIGAEVYATASESKWDAVPVDDDHLASSRDLGFAAKFGKVDVVLNSLAGEFTTASRAMLTDGGRFVEMGRENGFSLLDAGPGWVRETLAAIVDLFARGSLRPLPVRTWQMGRAPAALRFMAAAKHIGKIVLTLPGCDGTILVTGGTGVLGALFARHLVEHHGVRRLVLASRQGPSAEGADDLLADLGALGAEVTIVACDVTDRTEAERLLSGIDGLTGVVHTAGVLDDGVISSLTPERFEKVLRPKVDAAWHLHELTKDLDLFVVFSSIAGVMGAAGQGNYAAANAFLDALAHRRAEAGLPAVSLAWGWWGPPSGMTRHLGPTDIDRIRRAGVLPLDAAQGLTLFDEALRQGEPTLVPSRMNLAAMRHDVPAVWRGLVQPAAVQPAPVAEDAPPDMVTVVCHEAAAVLGQDVTPQQSFADLGFDSLTAVELRNQLNRVTGLRLRATLVFDHPTPAALAAYMTAELAR